MDIERVKELKNNISYLDENRNQIITHWTTVEDVRTILTKHDVDIEVFQNVYAHPVLSYFIDVVKGIQEIGNCPVIAKLIDYLQEKHITSSELFMICINFRKAIIKKIFAKKIMSESLYESIAYIFDANFKGVLEAFNETLAKAKEETNKLYELSIRDYLTNIYNRKMFDEILDLEIKAAIRNKTYFSIIILDIDDFKRINDSYGHEAGDKILISLTHLVQKILRNSDIFARWGGEEFVILMPKTSKNNAYNKTQEIRKIIETHNFETPKKLTCSFGVAQYEEIDTQSSLFIRADEALYMSKSQGKNTVTVF